MKKDIGILIGIISIVIGCLFVVGLIVFSIYHWKILPDQNREKMFDITRGDFSIIADKNYSGREFDTFPSDGKTMVVFLWKDKEGGINKQYVRFEDIDFEFTDIKHPIVNFNIEKEDFSDLAVLGYDVKYDDPSDVVDNLTLWGGHKITITIYKNQYDYYFSAIPVGDYSY